MKPNVFEGSQPYHNHIAAYFYFSYIPQKVYIQRILFTFLTFRIMVCIELLLLHACIYDWVFMVFIYLIQLNSIVVQKLCFQLIPLKQLNKNSASTTGMTFSNRPLNSLKKEGPEVGRRLRCHRKAAAGRDVLFRDREVSCRIIWSGSCQ